VTPTVPCGKSLALQGPDNYKLSIGVVTHNSARHVESCLQSLTQQSHKAFRVTFFDNASRDDSTALAASCATKFGFDHDIIRSKVNIGWAAAANRLIHLACPHLALILNPDTILHPHCLARLVSFAQSAESWAAATPNLQELSRHPSIGPLFTMRYDLKRGLILLDEHLPDGEASRVEIVSGTAILINTTAVNRPPFREDLFMYHEDVEFSLMQGLDEHAHLWVVPEAIVWHDTTASYARRSTCVWAIRNIYRLLWDICGPARYLCYAPRYLFHQIRQGRYYVRFFGPFYFLVCGYWALRTPLRATHRYNASVRAQLRSRWLKPSRPTSHGLEFVF
jgi:GT2 family glycosyltransferase